MLTTATKVQSNEFNTDDESEEEKDDPYDSDFTCNVLPDLPIDIRTRSRIRGQGSDQSNDSTGNSSLCEVDIEPNPKSKRNVECKTDLKPKPNKIQSNEFNTDDESEEEKDDPYDLDFTCNALPDLPIDIRTRSRIRGQGSDQSNDSTGNSSLCEVDIEPNPKSKRNVECKTDLKPKLSTTANKSHSGSSNCISSTSCKSHDTFSIPVKKTEDLDAKWHQLLEEASQISKSNKCTHRDQYMVLFDDNGIAEQASTASVVVFPSAKNLIHIHAMERPDDSHCHFGSVNYLSNEHGSFSKVHFKRAMEELKATRRSLDLDDNIITYVSESSHQVNNEYASINFDPSPTQRSIIKKMQEHTNLFIDKNLKVITKAATSKSFCDRGTVNPFTTGATVQVAQLVKYNKIYNCCASTKPFLDKYNSFEPSTAKGILYNHVGIQVLNFARNHQVFNLSNIGKVADITEDDLLFIRKKWWNRFSRSREFVEEEETRTKLNNIFWACYKEARKAIRIELLSSLCPDILDHVIENEFAELLLMYVQSSHSDVDWSTTVIGITYREAIEIISSAVAEAIAIRWSLDCGTHFDKLTCSWFHWTHFFSFRQYLSELPKISNQLTTKLQESAATDYKTKEPYQYCMVAGYGRKVVHDYCLRIAKQSMALESVYFSDLSKLIVTLLRKTQGTILDYQFIFECQGKLSGYYEKFKDTQEEKRLGMKGPVYLVPMAYSRMMWFSGFLHVLVSLFLRNEVQTDKETITLCVYFVFFCNGTSNIFGCYNEWLSNRNAYNGSFADNIFLLEKVIQERTGQAMSPGSCLNNRFQYSTLKGVNPDNMGSIVEAVTFHVRSKYQRCKNLSKLEHIHQEYMDLFGTISEKVPTFNHFRGCILFELLCLLQFYPLHFFQYATVNVKNPSCGPVAMMRKEFVQELSTRFYTSSENVPRNFRRPMKDLGIDKSDVHSDFSNVSGVIVLKYIQMELKTLGVDISMNDLEDVLCKIAKDYDDKKNPLTIQEIYETVKQEQTFGNKCTSTDPIYFDNHFQIPMNLFRVMVTAKKGPKLFMRNFDSTREDAVKKKNLTINWNSVTGVSHLTVSIQNHNSLNIFFQKKEK